MTITLHPTPELEAQMRERAARRNQPIEQYLLSLAEQDTAQPVRAVVQSARPVLMSFSPDWQETIRRIESGYQPAPEEREQAFRELVQGVPTGVSLSDADVRRENIYEDRY